MQHDDEWLVVSLGRERLSAPMDLETVLSHWLEKDLTWSDKVRPVTVLQDGRELTGVPGRDGVRDPILWCRADVLQRDGSYSFIGSGPCEEDTALPSILRFVGDWAFVRREPHEETLKVSVSPMPDGKGTRARNLTLVNRAARAGRALSLEEFGGGSEGREIGGYPSLLQGVGGPLEGDMSPAATIGAISSLMRNHMVVVERLFGTTLTRMEQLSAREQQLSDRMLQLAELGPHTALRRLEFQQEQWQAQQQAQLAAADAQRRMYETLGSQALQQIGGVAQALVTTRPQAAEAVERAVAGIAAAMPQGGG